MAEVDDQRSGDCPGMAIDIDALATKIAHALGSQLNAQDLETLASAVNVNGSQITLEALLGSESNGRRIQLVSNLFRSCYISCCVA